MSKKNPYGHGLTKPQMNALRWANDKIHLVTGSTIGGYFIVAPEWKRYIGMGRGTPTSSVRGLLEKDMVYLDKFAGRMVSNGSTGPLEVYRFTERAVIVLAENGGYKLPDGQVVKLGGT